LTIGAMATIGGLAGSLAAGAFAAGLSFGSGLLPIWSYDLLGIHPNPAVQRAAAERASAFNASYSRLIDAEILKPVARGIAKDSPNGLEDEEAIIASLLSQVRSTGGQAVFLAGPTEHRLSIRFSAESIHFDWDEQPSLVPRILADARLQANDGLLRRTNAELNRSMFSHVSDNITILREPSGSLSMTRR
jgi:hypothetical protein